MSKSYPVFSCTQEPSNKNNKHKAMKGGGLHVVFLVQIEVRPALK